MAARSNGHSGADEGLQYAQEGMEPVSAEHSSSYSAFSSFPTDGPIPVNSFSSTHFHESEGSYDENSVSSCIHHVQTQPCDLPVDPKRRKLCRIPQRILLWIVPPALILSWLVAGLVGYEIRHANEHSSALRTDSEDSSSSSIVTTATATTIMTATASLASVATPTSTTMNDLAGCPANNGTTYKSGSYTYVRICGIKFSGDDLQSSFTPSFEACMDSCTAYNNAHADNATCVGASYDIFDPTDFSKNEGCFLKTGQGVPVASSSLGKTCDSALIIST